MKISPFSAYSYRQSFTSTQKANNDDNNNSLDAIRRKEAIQQAQKALIAIDEMKKEGGKCYKEAEHYLEKSKKYYQKIEDILAKPTGLDFENQDTIFKIGVFNDDITMTSQYDKNSGSLLFKRYFRNPDEIITMTPTKSEYGDFDRIYINQDENESYYVVNIGRTEFKDSQYNKESYEFDGKELKSLALDSSTYNRIGLCKDAKIYGYSNNKPADVIVDMEQNPYETKFKKLFAFENGKVVSCKRNYTEKNYRGEYEDGFYRNINGEITYEKGDCWIVFKDGKMIKYIKNKDFGSTGKTVDYILNFD